jgi:hypothetical protein
LGESDKCLFSGEEVNALTVDSESESFLPPFRYVEGGMIKEINKY